MAAGNNNQNNQNNINNNHNVQNINETVMPEEDTNSPNHPLYLHPNDHHGLILISKKLTGSDNYSTWKRTNGDRDQRKRLIQFLIGLDECYSNLRGQIILMQHLPTVAKAYGMIRQEEKQREGIMPKNLGPQEGHSKDECYKLKRYPVGRPLHGKYKPSTVKNISVPKVVNLVTRQNQDPNTPFTSGSNNINEAIFVRMDQLQNQLNQVMLMMQNAKKTHPQVKENQEKDKIGSKPDKNEKRGKAGKS
nr:cysteine-rich RLK (receptor-like protein kinase) 8 [Tanacetum cinerariifolium]